MTIAEKLKFIADNYGLESRLEKTKEELEELRVAIEDCQHYGLTNKTKLAIVDEIADVLILCRELEFLIGNKLVGDRVQFKLDRQIKRINNNEQ